ncbi:U2 snRNP-associated SURP motif-containing protein [Cimex lectularius]|uniref:U2 snRNP-associated SURP motif-containing protein n=1 Tax=Cimex lectularius TaxID=79782 RepID=A0A8I6SH20_CIMLE|nr:U2 snRNP-associated SURP motif-containing protein [Cimex lectularius]
MADKVLKHIPEQKLKAFSIGTMGKRQLSKREIEENKKREQEKAAAQAFEEFVATFQEAPTKTNKVWVKAGTYDAGKRQEDTKEKGKLYKPQSRLDFPEKNSAERAQEYAKLLGERSKPERPGKKKEKEKKKSNLELFKEELKMIQEEREERHKYKGAIKAAVVDPDFVKNSGVLPEEKGSFDCGDPNTTNIYLGNINPKITEQQLMEVFGKYGPLASIKIMWPRSDEEKSRGRNCGFVAFMNRKDGDRAMKALNGKDILGYEMKLGWGKFVPIPPFPIYIPPNLLSLTQPPPPSGLPFNAQPHPRDRNRVPRMKTNEPYPVNPEDMDKVEKILPQALVKVVIPTDRNLLMLIHRMIEYVIREGPMFEAMIMNREINNPMFRFLFDNQSPAHTYYRWKLFSLLQGDSQKEWRLQEFRMFKNGSIWRPPPLNLYTQGMPEELIEKDDDRKGGLSPAQRDRLEQLIRHMTPERMKVADAMVFCIEHSEAADEICDCIVESLGNPDTLLYKKVARLYLVSDILHNCSIKITHASYYRRCLESRLLEIFYLAHITYTSLESRLKAESFRVRVMNIFKAWDDWAVYPREFLIRLKSTFLGTPITHEDEEETRRSSEVHDDDIDGIPCDNLGSEMDQDDLDGVPLDGATLLKGAYKHTNVDDIDGIPMDDDIDGKPMEFGSKKTQPTGAFVPSRWETVDPELLEQQAMTTSKWELIEQQQGKPTDEHQSQQENCTPDDSLDSCRDIQEEIRRARLREIEVKVMQYQDELESGKRSLKVGWTVAEQIEHHRKKLLRKSEKVDKDKVTDKAQLKRTPSPVDSQDSRGCRRSKRSKSSSLSPPPSKRSYRSRSRSPYGRRRRSRTPPSHKNSPGRRRSPVSSRKRRGGSSPDANTPRRRRGSSGEPSPPHSHKKHSSRHKHKHRH